MSFWGEVKTLIYKELLLEWKQKYAINGLLLYVVSIVFVISFTLWKDFTPESWNIIFWIIMLFVSINVVAKSFIGESRGQTYYLYTLAGPMAIILAKIIYNSSLLIFIGFVSLLLFQVFSPNKIEDFAMFSVVLCMASACFSANLTLVSAIASKAENKTTLLTVLSFPLTIPLLLTAIKAGSTTIKGLDRSFLQDEQLFFLSFFVIIVMLSLLLFPFVWRD